VFLLRSRVLSGGFKKIASLPSMTLPCIAQDPCRIHLVDK
jgi:hypothetical protein